VREERAGKVCIDDRFARADIPEAARLHEQEPFGVKNASDPGRDAIARDVPRVRQGIRLTKPARGSKHRDPAGAKRVWNPGCLGDEDTLFQTRRKDVGVLVHRQHRHPVSGILWQPQPVMHIADDVGERAAAWYNDDALSAGSGDYLEDRIETLDIGQQAATELHDYVHAHGPNSVHCSIYTGVHLC
jgi:hypothetical protein